MYNSLSKSQASTLPFQRSLSYQASWNFWVVKNLLFLFEIIFIEKPTKIFFNCTNLSLLSTIIEQFDRVGSKCWQHSFVKMVAQMYTNTIIHVLYKFNRFYIKMYITKYLGNCTYVFKSYTHEEWLKRQ